MPKKLLTFFMQFLRNPLKTGAIVPTQGWVARRVIGHIPRQIKAVVEYGPGTGAVTLPLLKALPPGCELFAIERNSTFAKKLRNLSKPNLHVIEGNAADCAQYVTTPDVILSALPFRSFSRKQREEVLTATARVLPPHGIFIVYLQYTPFLEQYLHEYFGEITREFEWRNIPPTFIYVCRKPKVQKLS